MSLRQHSLDLVFSTLIHGFWTGVEREESAPLVVQQQLERVSSGATWQEQYVKGSNYLWLNS